MTTRKSFRLLGEPLALDLVNTCVLERGVPLDLLDGTAALSAWLRAEAQRVDWPGGVAHADLDAVCLLRDTIDVLLRARLAHRVASAASLQRFNRALAVPTADTRLEWTRGGPRRARSRTGTARERLLRTLALDALEVLTGAEAPLLRECAHPGCQLLFLARNPRRRWCSGATCGNRARVSRHYAQNAGRPGS